MLCVGLGLTDTPAGLRRFLQEQWRQHRSLQQYIGTGSHEVPADSSDEAQIRSASPSDVSTSAFTAIALPVP